MQVILNAEIDHLCCRVNDIYADVIMGKCMRWYLLTRSSHLLICLCFDFVGLCLSAVYVYRAYQRGPKHHMYRLDYSGWPCSLAVYFLSILYLVTHTHT